MIKAKLTGIEVVVVIESTVGNITKTYRLNAGEDSQVFFNRVSDETHKIMMGSPKEESN